MFSEIKLHRMSFILLVNILLSGEDCQALHKEPFINSCVWYCVRYTSFTTQVCRPWYKFVLDLKIARANFVPGTLVHE